MNKISKFPYDKDVDKSVICKEKRKPLGSPIYFQQASL